MPLQLHGSLATKSPIKQPAHCEEYEFYDFHTKIIGFYLKVAALCKNFHFSGAWMLTMLHQYVCLIQRRSPY